MGWLSGWGRRKSHTIDGSTAGAQTNYQIRIVAYKGSGTDSGEEVYLGTNVRDDFGDVRFTRSDGITLLDYWIESYTLGTKAIFWVEVDSIPASPDSVDIYIYYDKPDAITTSNIANAFLFGDEDFALGWSLRYGSVTSWSVSDGILSLDGTTTDGWVAKDWSGAIGDNIRCIVRFRRDLAEGGNTKWGYEGNNAHAPSLAGAYDSPTGTWRMCADDGVTERFPAVFTEGIASGVWYRVYWTRVGGTFKLWVDDTYKGSVGLTVTPLTPPINAGFEIYRDNSSFDYIAFGKYVEPEPSHGAWGSEEIVAEHPLISRPLVSHIIVAKPIIR